jgi:hypothetical protein
MLLVCFWLGFAVLHQYGWEWMRLDEQAAWAMLLPGVYAVGMLILRD